jgi:hypothetical protein
MIEIGASFAPDGIVLEIVVVVGRLTDLPR